jgi:leucyl-tRNA synthetase
MEKYDPKEIEGKWQKFWEENPQLFSAKENSDQEKKYVLDMFPYPSGEGLHVGHVESYTATDIISRYYRMNDKNVLHPQGWDAFGLPAENYAIKTGTHPSVTTENNIKNFTRQIKSLGMSYDWSREINTSKPEYYKWTQWFFLLLYKNGLAYKKMGKVNWCPSCQTVLANEQVEDGICERCKNEVIQKDLEQWYFKITDFIETNKQTPGLIEGLEKIDWPESTKAAQRNWIGKSEGTIVKFKIAESEEFIEVFTTRVDTIFGCTYCVVAPEHKILQALKERIVNFSEVEKYLEETKKKTDLERMENQKEKTGVRLEGVSVINPFTNESVPLFVADYVLGGYGTGAVMAVPAHDERDLEFAKVHGLEIKIVIEPVTGQPRKNEEKRNSIVAIVENPKDGKLLSINWGEKLGGNLFIGGGLKDGEDALETAIREIKEETGYKNVELIETSEKIHHHYFAFSKNVARDIEAIGFYFKLKDEEREQQNLEADEEGKFQVEWLTKEEAEKKVGDDLHKYLFNKFIRQQIFTEDGILNETSADFSGLNSEVAREKMANWLADKKLGEKKINYRLRDWLVSRQRYWGAPIPIIYCETCGEVPVPEKDLPVMLPTDVDFKPTGESPLRYSPSFQDVVCPKCGQKARRESDTMDTFVCSSWYYLRYADPKNLEIFVSKEKLEKWLPVDLYVGGAEHSVLHLLYARFFTKVLHNLGFVNFDEPFLKMRHQGIILAEDGRKMSKSLGNVVNPDDIVKQFGADSLRMFEMFMGPLEDMKPWNTKGIVGVKRFLDKVWKMQDKTDLKIAFDSKLQAQTYKTIKKVTDDIEAFRFNTAISALMILVNAMDKQASIHQAAYELLVKLLSPFAPHLCEEIWQNLGKTESIFADKWPVYDANLAKEEEVEMVVQVNGKVRDRLVVATDVTEDEIKETALESEKVKVFIEGKEIKKIIFVPEKLINIVVA